jgi:hypothetical protein
VAEGHSSWQSAQQLRLVLVQPLCAFSCPAPPCWSNSSRMFSTGIAQPPCVLPVRPGSGPRTRSACSYFTPRWCCTRCRARCGGWRTPLPSMCPLWSGDTPTPGCDPPTARTHVCCVWIFIELPINRMHDCRWELQPDRPSSNALCITRCGLASRSSSGWRIEASGGGGATCGPRASWAPSSWATTSWRCASAGRRASTSGAGLLTRPRQPSHQQKLLTHDRTVVATRCM